MKKGFFKRYFISGLLVWIPIVVTVWVVNAIVNLLDSSLDLLPRGYRPDDFFGFHIPFVGVVLTLFVIFITGVLAANFIGDRLVALWDRFLNHIPLVRTVHTGVKQVMNTLLSPQGRAFRKVVLIQWPREGMWSIGFETGNGCKEVNEKTGGEELVTVFVVTTPNPTSGFIMMMPRKDIIELEMGVDQALKFVVSIGVMQPSELKKTKV